jgi:uncharacterized membrane protein YjfL (UPF0719 family)
MHLFNYADIAAWEPSHLMILSRVIMILAWGYALCATWRKFKDTAGANQAIAGALAMILCQVAILFSSSIPAEVLVFFLAMAQVILVSAFVKLAMAHHDLTAELSKLRRQAGGMTMVALAVTSFQASTLLL